MPNFGIGDIVTVRGYGGHAQVINMEVDGVTPQGYPKYLCTVRFGPYATENETLARIDLPYGPVRKPGVPRDRVHQFYAGRLTNILEDIDDDGVDDKPTKKKSTMTEEARKAALLEIEIEMKMLEQELRQGK